jgi:hypothetical protein
MEFAGRIDLRRRGSLIVLFVATAVLAGGAQAPAPSSAAAATNQAEAGCKPIPGSLQSEWGWNPVTEQPCRLGGGEGSGGVIVIVDPAACPRAKSCLPSQPGDGTQQSLDDGWARLEALARAEAGATRGLRRLEADRKDYEDLKRRLQQRTCRRFLRIEAAILNDWDGIFPRALHHGPKGERLARVRKIIRDEHCHQILGLKDA